MAYPVRKFHPDRNNPDITGSLREEEPYNAKVRSLMQRMVHYDIDPRNGKLSKKNFLSGRKAYIMNSASREHRAFRRARHHAETKGGLWNFVPVAKDILTWKNVAHRFWSRRSGQTAEKRGSILRS
jgi:hypothetical protein